MDEVMDGELTEHVCFSQGMTAGHCPRRPGPSYIKEPGHLFITGLGSHMTSVVMRTCI